VTDFRAISIAAAPLLKALPKPPPPSYAVLNHFPSFLLVRLWETLVEFALTNNPQERSKQGQWVLKPLRHKPFNGGIGPKELLMLGAQASRLHVSHQALGLKGQAGTPAGPSSRFTVVPRIY
jgi:hypothetical protein